MKLKSKLSFKNPDKIQHGGLVDNRTRASSHHLVDSGRHPQATAQSDRRENRHTANNQHAHVQVRETPVRRLQMHDRPCPRRRHIPEPNPRREWNRPSHPPAQNRQDKQPRGTGYLRDNRCPVC